MARKGEDTMSSALYPNPQAIFYQQYESVRRDEVVGILLALFLGAFGIHHFYLRRTGLGILYLCFFWTGITSILGVIECFFMPGRVREFNAIQAAGIAAAMGIPVPGWGQPGQPINVNVTMPAAGAAPVAEPGTLLACGRCGRTNPQGARYCAGCGAAL
jgi:TM2 domain-containing membrane protein YozV